MSNNHRAVVAAVKNHSYARSSLRQSFQHLLDRMEPPLSGIFKTGNRVLVKPFLHLGQHSNYLNRSVSHPEVVRMIVKALKDCGAVVAIGDEGSKKIRNCRVPQDKQWIHDLAKETGADLVSFAKTGARHVRGGLRFPFPRHYLIANAVLEADAVVNCANFQPHRILGMVGAVKNMFNSVAGMRQQHLHELFPNPQDLARVIVDVCAVVKPTVSFLDLTTVRDPEKNGIHPIGLLLAGCDPVALDAVAAHAVGWDGGAIPTLSWGEKHGLGCMDPRRITLSGLDWAEIKTISLPKATVAVAEPETIYDKVTRHINKTILRPRPTIEPALCAGCGDCRRICPVQAIHISPSKGLAIDPRTCVDCHFCMATCEHGAIQLRHRGAGKAIRQLMQKPLTVQ